MKAVLQRVTRADCVVDGRTTGEIGAGLTVLLGVGHGDTPATARALAARTAKLRIFADDAGRMNRSLLDVHGEVLSISQFTLYADTRHGNRPGFTGAAAPDVARTLYAEYNAALRELGVTVGEGVFGADMRVTLSNDGPVTILLDSSDRP
ncbi:D-aminoacyl-tRNA deacylase [Deinococcus aquiradiocola]|uniref:D-aminoacyl-tRNA deacylase n=1 Tax=Deinococcus aquiradiocola TaxID=393059 RepID=A0A917PDT5_9DEIO|nr:D-aminoacyl-tRNA deacylase [Deinococcus aquiradiocola]GGJ71949.1 D-aminoacyl-tRNA deacylase [Deinococcus aquiradiocola]